MKFEINRASCYDEKPHDEAIEFYGTYMDYRTVSTIKEAKNKFWFNNWFNKGENHREEDGKIVCDGLKKLQLWTIEINSISELMNIYSSLIIDKSNFKECDGCITIYDAYIE